MDLHNQKKKQEYNVSFLKGRLQKNVKKKLGLFLKFWETILNILEIFTDIMIATVTGP